MDVYSVSVKVTCQTILVCVNGKWVVDARENCVYVVSVLLTKSLIAHDLDGTGYAKELNIELQNVISSLSSVKTLVGDADIGK